MSCRVVLGVCMLVVCIGIRAEDVWQPTFRPPPHPDSVSPACSKFTMATRDRREFYSPGYPNHYPNNTNCIHLLIAPQGYRIRLDFRDDFFIEPSGNCEYDYVEFRDGPFGYSPLIGRFCGSDHPQMMQSKSRFIWVHFQSDDSIEYSGFHAVFEYFQDDTSQGDNTPESEWNFTVHEDEVCRIVVDTSLHDGYIENANIPQAITKQSKSANTSLDCTWAFYAPEKYRLKLKFIALKVGACAESFMEIYENTTAHTAQKGKKVCGTPEAPIVQTSSNRAYVRAYGRRAELIPDFTIFFTVFQPGPCGDNMFQCDRDTCINKSLECNGRDNCPYKADEQGCNIGTTVEPTREPFVIQYHTIIIGIVGGAILTIIFLAIVITCHQKKKEEATQRQALRHNERHGIEVEMTNLLNRSPQHPGLNAVAAHSSQSNPNGPMNHIGASSSKPQQPMMNHVGQGSPHLPAHSQAIMGHQNGTTPDYEPQLVHLQRPGRTGDYTDHNGGSGSYGKFLDVHSQKSSKSRDKDSNTKPSKHNQIPTVATIEKRPNAKGLPLSDKKDRYRGPPPRDRTPSPRPDVVQEEKFMYPQSRSRESLSSRSPAPRRMSNETERSDKSEVWKPMTSRDISKMPGHDKTPLGRSTAPPQAGPSSAPQYRPPPTSQSEYNWTPQREQPYEHYSDWRREGIGFEPIASDPSLYARPTTSKQYPLPDDYSTVEIGRRKADPPAPPQRRTATLQHQSSAPMPPTDTGSPPLYRATYSRTPPAKPKIPQSKSASNVTQSKSRQSDKNPAMFYTRPNQGRAERTEPKQHHPV